jgi:hypothetical protein
MRPTSNSRAFTLLEVALIVGIIGMILLMVIGYLLAPAKPAQLPPVQATTPIPSSAYPSPAQPKTAPKPKTVTPPTIFVPPAPATAPAPPPIADPAPATPEAPAAPAPSATPAVPAATPAPTQTIDLSPQSNPIFR